MVTRSTRRPGRAHDPADPDASARRALARRVAETIAREHGIGFDDGTIIADANHTIVGMDAEHVAKVATSTLHEQTAGIDREAVVLVHLGRSSAPTSRLSVRLPPGPHDVDGCRAIVLERLRPLDEIPSAEAALATLTATQRALADVPDAGLPAFLDGLDIAADLLASSDRTPRLPEVERTFCRTAAADLRTVVAESRWVDVVLHGDPWIGGNLIDTSDGTRLLDFEATCRGPVEWDLSSLGELADRVDDADDDLLAACRLLRSFTVAAWCWAMPDRTPEVGQAARWHLELLHRGLE